MTGHEGSLGCLTESGGHHTPRCTRGSTPGNHHHPTQKTLDVEPGLPAGEQPAPRTTQPQVDDVKHDEKGLVSVDGPEHYKLAEELLQVALDDLPGHSTALTEEEFAALLERSSLGSPRARYLRQLATEADMARVRSAYPPDWKHLHQESYNIPQSPFPEPPDLCKEPGCTCPDVHD